MFSDSGLCLLDFSFSGAKKWGQIGCLGKVAQCGLLLVGC